MKATQRTETCLEENVSKVTESDDALREGSDESIYPKESCDRGGYHQSPHIKEGIIGGAIDIHENKIIKVIVTPILKLGAFCKLNSSIIKNITIVLFIFFYTAYMIIALTIDFQRALPLLFIFCMVSTYQIYILLGDYYGDEIWSVWKPVYYAVARNILWLKWIGVAIIVMFLALFIALDVAQRPRQLVSVVGYVTFVLFLWIVGSKYPEKVRWRPVIWGFTIQILLACLILRVEAAFKFFNWIGLFVETLLDYVIDGSIMVFGKLYYQHFLAFKVFPIVIYFGAFISVMYYLGAMQWLIYKMAWIMQFTLGTSGTESMCAAGNIFVGIVESPLLIRPYLQDITTSELFAVMTAGFGTIAGSVLGAYLGFGIKAVYVITACIMAAPCALAVAKLVYPETKVSKFRDREGLALEPPDQTNIIEAAFVGASTAIPMVLNIGANVIAFISLLAAINGFLNWFGGLVDYPQLSFEAICSYLFVPITFLMGIDWEDCFKCAELLGTKTFLNEFIAYEELSRLIKMKNNGTYLKFNDNGTINWINDRSEAIMTYALCGFANFGSLGIMLGSFGALCPQRQKEISEVILRALLAGGFVNILNACAAGFFYAPNPNCQQIYNTTSWNGTVELRVLRSCCEDAVMFRNSSYSEYERCCNYAWEDIKYSPLQCR